MTDYSISLLNHTHVRTHFNCSEPSLDDYLQKQARQDIRRSLSVCYVLTNSKDTNVLGYYTLSASSIALYKLDNEIQKKLPRYPSLPVTLIGRLAIDSILHGVGLGEMMLVNALKRSLHASNDVGSMAVIVNAINTKAAAFYQRYGFFTFKGNAHQLYLPMKQITSLFNASSDSSKST